MVYRKFIHAYVAVLLALGLPLLLAPYQTLRLFGADLNPAGASMSAFYGSSMLGVAWMMWKARDAADSDVLEGLMHGNLIIFALSFVLSILGQVQAIYNPLGLVVTGLSVLFTAWYGFIRRATRRTGRS